MRRDSNLAELGITAAEFEEFNAATAKRPRREDAAAGDLAGASLAMGMDVDPAVAAAGARTGTARPRNGEAASDCNVPTTCDCAYHLHLCCAGHLLPSDWLRSV